MTKNGFSPTSRTRVGIAALAAGGVVAIAVVIARSGSASPSIAEDPAVETKTPMTSSDLLAECPAGMMDGGDIDGFPPASEAEVREGGWSTSALESAERALAGGNLSLPPYEPRDLTLDSGTIVPQEQQEDGSPYGERIQYRVLDPKGITVAFINVDDVGFGAYAPTSSFRCAS